MSAVLIILLSFPVVENVVCSGYLSTIILELQLVTESDHYRKSIRKVKEVSQQCPTTAFALLIEVIKFLGLIKVSKKCTIPQKL